MPSDSGFNFLPFPCCLPLLGPLSLLTPASPHLFKNWLSGLLEVSHPAQQTPHTRGSHLRLYLRFAFSIPPFLSPLPPGLPVFLLSCLHGCLMPQLIPLLCGQLTPNYIFWMSQWGNFLVLCSLDYPPFHFLFIMLVIVSIPSHPV